MTIFRRILPATFALLPLLSHAFEAGTCHYASLAKLNIDVPEHRLPTVTGSINGKPAPMLVDTGSYETMLVRPGAERLGLRLEPTGDFDGGAGGSAAIYLARVQDFSVGPSHSGKLGVRVLGGLSFKPDFDAIIGDDYLLQTDLEVSMTDKYLQFFSASGCADTFLAYWDANAMEVPFIGRRAFSEGRTPMVEVELNGVKMKAIIDTGAMATAVHRHAAEQAGIRLDTPGVRKIGQGSGAGTRTVDQWLVDFKRFRIGDETVNNPQMVVIDDSPGGISAVDVVLGMDFLRAHRVLFAMSQNRLYLSYLGGDLFGASQKAPEAASQGPKAP